MDIVKDMVDDFRVAAIKVGAAVSGIERDIADFEFLLIHNKLGYKVRGYVTVGENDVFIARSTPMGGLSSSEPARKKFRKYMINICKCIMKEHK
jgi:hypothetical protein